MADNLKPHPRELAKKGQELAKKKSLERYKKFLTSQTARREAGEVSAEDSAKQSRAFWHKENPRFARRRYLKRAEDKHAMGQAHQGEHLRGGLPSTLRGGGPEGLFGRGSPVTKDFPAGRAPAPIWKWLGRPTPASELNWELTKSPRAVARKTEGLNRADDARHGAFRMAPNPSRASILTKARRNKK